MDEFPDPDEEFDLIENHQTPKKSLADESHGEKTKEPGNEESSRAEENSSDIHSTENNAQLHQNGDVVPVQSTKKRTYEELLGDFGDILTDESFAYIPPETREKRPRWTDAEAVIDLILQQRKKHLAEENGIENARKRPNLKPPRDSISTSVPRWNFVVLTKLSDFQRLYVRVSENKKKNLETSGRPASGLFALPFDQMKAEAEEIILRNTERASRPQAAINSKTSHGQLWVEKYRPRSYMELLTDETVNRACLRWIKLWDKVVFNREVVKRKKTEPEPKFGNKKFSRKTEDDGVDARGFPVQRIALLSGPPGLGKTTLAHLVARHAGYNVVEINASDDRSAEAFREALLAATEMRSLMGVDPKPNCLILDEIDGASAASIELLIKYVQGKLVQRGKKKQETGKTPDGCKRPVICICNEAYAPSLRPLRATAFIIPVPKIDPSRLADRLAEIAYRERLKADRGALLQLAQRSGCDVRSCLCALQYMGEASVDNNFNLGLKDTKRGIFDCWKDILQVPMSKGGLMPIRERVQCVLKAAYSGETERLAQGIFHNYPETSPPKIDLISKALEWFQLYDKITTVVMTKQDWRIMPYTNYAFVAWHFNLASNQYVKISYPYAPGEAKQKLIKSIAMLNATKRVYGRDIETLTLDIAPFLHELLTPTLRSVSGHLYSTAERANLERLINVMLDLGLSLVQTKTEGRVVDYNFDPNLCEIGVFPECKMRISMPYAVKQIVARELEMERLRRAAVDKKYQNNDSSAGFEVRRKITKNVEKNTSKSQVAADTSKSQVPVVPNHLRQLEPMPVQKNKTKYRNFFENFVPKEKTETVTVEKQTSPRTSPRGKKMINRFREILSKHGVYYKYKEGYSNAVRRNVKISDLL